MKKFYLLPIFIMLFLACDRQDQEPPEPTDFGYLSMNISVTITEEAASSRIAAVPTDDWSVTIFNASDDSEVINFTPFIDAPAEVQLPTGEYYIEANSNNFQEAAFENPYYFGRSANFTIDKEELTTIDIDAELANAKVAINYSSNVTSTFDTYSGVVTVVSSGASLPYAQGETREGYFVAEPLEVVVDLSYTKLDGTLITRQFTANIDAQPKTLYNIKVDATLEDGRIVINIRVNESFETVEIELGDSDPDPNAEWVAGEDWTDPRDGQTYGTVQIGDQIWMTENIRFLPSITPLGDWTITGTSNLPAYNVYGYAGSSVTEAELLPEYATYGVLYNWNAALGNSPSTDEVPSTSQGVCPAGWVVPSLGDWDQLISELGFTSNAGGILKSTGTEFWNDPNEGATNAVGFSALPGGYIPTRNLGISGHWWTASEAGANNGRGKMIMNQAPRIFTESPEKYFGLSVRCLKAQ